MTPVFWGVPVAVWALIVSSLSFTIALVALGWQIIKHFLDGGRVKVYLNTAILEPEVGLMTNRSGRFLLPRDDSALAVTHGRGIELAQLVVENSGRVPVTIHSPGLSFKGHGKKNHSIVPRQLETGPSLGADTAVTDTVVRIEPYDRVTFLLDYWSVIPRLFRENDKKKVTVRGHVGVAGRTNRPQKSSRRRQWCINRGMYTAIEGSPSFTPFAVLWRELYLRLPERAENSDRPPESGPPITRGLVGDILDSAMSRFDHRPERDELGEALNEIAIDYGDHFPMFRSLVWHGYNALDRINPHLTDWTEGLFFKSHRERQMKKNTEDNADETN